MYIRLFCTSANLADGLPVVIDNGSLLELMDSSYNTCTVEQRIIQPKKIPAWKWRGF